MLERLRAFVRGESYWTVRFLNGKALSELDFVPRLDQNAVLRVRAVEWLEDIIGAGMVGAIKEVSLHTPKGTACLTVSEPYTVFQFSRGTLDLLTGRRIKNMQCVGVVTDKATGACECAIWDQQTRELYTLHNNVLDFAAWREGVAPIGRLALETMDVRGVGGIATQ